MMSDSPSVSRPTLDAAIEAGYKALKTARPPESWRGASQDWDLTKRESAEGAVKAALTHLTAGGLKPEPSDEAKAAALAALVERAGPAITGDDGKRLREVDLDDCLRVAYRVDSVSVPSLPGLGGLSDEEIWAILERFWYPAHAPHAASAKAKLRAELASREGTGKP